MTHDRDEARLSELLEGLLPDDEAAALEERCRNEPELARARDELERILADPVQLEPCEPPASLEAWVREVAADPPAPGAEDDEVLAGELEPVSPPAHLREWVRAQAASAARDPLAEPLDLERPEVPAHLVAWVGERAREAASDAGASAEAEEAREGRLLVFPRAAVLALAAALLVGLGLGLLAGRSGQGQPPREVAQLRADLVALQQELAEASGARESAESAQRKVSRLLDQREQDLSELRKQQQRAQTAQQAAEQALARLEARSESLSGELAQARQERDQVAERLRARRDEFAAQGQELARVQAALAQRPAGDPELERRLGARERELAQVRASLAARAQEAARLRAKLDQGGVREGTPLRVASARGVRRWDDERGWVALAAGEALAPGSVLAGAGLYGQVALEGDRSKRRLGSQLYVVTRAGLEPLPELEGGHAPLPRGAGSRGEPDRQGGGGLLAVVRGG